MFPIISLSHALLLGETQVPMCSTVFDRSAGHAGLVCGICLQEIEGVQVQTKKSLVATIYEF